MSRKLFVLLVIAFCYDLSFTNAAEADWEVLNFAINEPEKSNPEIVKNSVLNILKGFVPTGPVIVTSPTTPATAPPPPPPTAAPMPLPTNPPVTQPPPTAAPYYPPYPVYMPQQGQQFFPFPFPYPQSQQQQQSQPQPQPQQQAIPALATLPTAPTTAAPQPAACPSCYQQSCSCRNQKKNLAEFVVDVPCPTTTPKPMKQIVVKVPCPTTTKKPCECQCCPCNPCKSAKKKQYRVSSEEESEEEVKTVYKSYDPVIKKYVDAQRNDAPRTRQTSSYQPRGDYQPIAVRRDYDGYLNKK